MSARCCEPDDVALVALRERQRSVLQIVLAVNTVLFAVEFGVGWWARSTAVLADSLDMLGDAFVYAFSLWVLQRGAHWRARAAVSKGVVQLVFGLVVLCQAAWHAIDGTPPAATAMALVTLIALAGNSYAFGLLWRHRSDDINMRSTWVCSRNDLIANVAVLGAAAAVWQLNSVWPDVIVGVAIALLFLRTAVGLISDARDELASLDGALRCGANAPECCTCG